MNVLEKFRDIHTFIFDVDGVFTDGGLLIAENGDMLRQMSVRDGYAVKRAIESGYAIYIITGGSSLGVKSRLEKLGVKEIHIGIHDKMSTYNDIIAQNNLDEDGILYMGDDIPDYEVMRRVGLPVCPNDAVKEIVDVAYYVSPIKGGKGCVRDVIEKVMRLHEKW